MPQERRNKSTDQFMPIEECLLRRACFHCCPVLVEGEGRLRPSVRALERGKGKSAVQSLHLCLCISCRLDTVALGRVEVMSSCL